MAHGLEHQAKVLGLPNRQLVSSKEFTTNFGDFFLFPLSKSAKISFSSENMAVVYEKWAN